MRGVELERIALCDANGWVTLCIDRVLSPPGVMNVWLVVHSWPERPVASKKEGGSIGPPWEFDARCGFGLVRTEPQAWSII